MQEYSKESNGDPGRFLIFSAVFSKKKTGFVYKKWVCNQNRNLKAKFLGLRYPGLSCFCCIIISVRFLDNIIAFHCISLKYNLYRHVYFILAQF